MEYTIDSCLKSICASYSILSALNYLIKKLDERD